MARPRPIEQIDLGVSWRMHSSAGPCCYVTLVSMRTDGTRQVIESKHLTGEPLALVDQVLELVRELTLEHFLPLTSPF